MAEKIKLAILGLGRIGWGMVVGELGLYEDKYEVVAVCDLIEDRRNKAKDKFGCPTYEEYAEMLKQEDIEMVYIATRSCDHYTHAMMACAAGKHVLLEKPFCPEVSLAQELVQIAWERGLILVDMVPTAFLPNLQVLKEQLPKIGKIRLVMSNYTQYSSRYDRFRSGETDNVFNPVFAGGSLMDINFYNVYLNIALFGKPNRAVYHPNIQRGIDTSGVITLEYDGFVSQNAGAKDSRGINFFQIEGEDGYIYIPGGVSSLEEIQVVTKDGTEVFRTPHDPDLWAWEVRGLAQLIGSGNTAPLAAGLETMLGVIETIETARKAAGIHFPEDRDE